MPTPFDRYLRFLATKGIDDLRDVNDLLGDLNLPNASDEEFGTQLEIVEGQLPKGVRSQIRTGAHSVDFLPAMKVLEVEELWHFEKLVFLPKEDPLRSVVKLVYDIHQDLALRATINALLIKNVPGKDIAHSVNLRYSALLKEEHINIYSKFFFSAQSMTRGGWRAYLKRCPGSERSLYFTALTEPLDAVKTELELPAKHSTGEVLQYLLTKSTQKAKRLLDDETPSGRAEALRWVDMVLRVTDKYERYRSGDQVDFANSLQMEFTFVDTEFATPDDELLKEAAERQRLAKKEAEAG